MATVGSVGSILFSRKPLRTLKLYTFGRILEDFPVKNEFQRQFKGINGKEKRG